MDVFARVDQATGFAESYFDKVCLLFDFEHVCTSLVLGLIFKFLKVIRQLSILEKLQVPEG